MTSLPTGPFLRLTVLVQDLRSPDLDLLVVTVLHHVLVDAAW